MSAWREFAAVFRSLFRGSETCHAATRQSDHDDPVGLISRQRNRPSNNRLDPSVAERVMGILRESYADFGPTLATEKLLSSHQIDLAKESDLPDQSDPVTTALKRARSSSPLIAGPLASPECARRQPHLLHNWTVATELSAASP